MTPSSTVTHTSSFFISGRSALRRYPRSSSLISTSGDQSATVRLSISPLPILFGKLAKKNGLKRFCASSISLRGFHVIALFNVFILFLPFWIQLKPSWCIALTAYCQSRPESCARRVPKLGRSQLLRDSLSTSGGEAVSNTRLWRSQARDSEEPGVFSIFSSVQSLQYISFLPAIFRGLLRELRRSSR